MSEPVQRVSFGPIVYDAASEGGYVYRLDYNRDETIANLTAVANEFNRMMQRIAEVLQPLADELNRAALSLGASVHRQEAFTARFGKRRVRFRMRHARWRVGGL